MSRDDMIVYFFFFFSSRRRHTRCSRDWSSDVCSSDLGFAVLITLGLTLGTVILSSAFTTGDTMSQSVRTVVAGVLGSADEVAFVPAADQHSGWDLAQSIATGALLTGVTSYFPVSDTQQLQDLVAADSRVSAVVPVIVEQVPVAGDGQA